MLTRIERYLKENMDVDISIKDIEDKNIFPVFLRSYYNFYKADILGMTYVMIEGIDDMPSVDRLKKHISQIEKITNLKSILIYKEITRYRRKTLIENRLSFVIEDGQMYLPFLGLALKRANEYIENKVEKFTTSAQLAYLYFLYNKDVVMNVTTFAKELGFTTMTASRALNDLYQGKLLSYEIGGKTGRSKQYKRISDPDYFFMGAKYLRSPVREIIFTEKKPINTLSAGLDALAELSMLNPPKHPIVALDKARYNLDEIKIIKNKDKIKDMNLVEVQVWDYDPKLFTDTEYVDLLSLYASLKDEKDERIEQALEEILEGETWYTV